jgi:hypothetical protein
MPLPGWVQLAETAGFNDWLLGASRLDEGDFAVGLIWNAALVGLLEGAPDRFRVLWIAGTMCRGNATDFMDHLRGLGSSGEVLGVRDYRARVHRLRRAGLLRPSLSLNRLLPIFGVPERLTQDGESLARLITKMQAATRATNAVLH